MDLTLDAIRRLAELANEKQLSQLIVEEDKQKIIIITGIGAVVGSQSAISAAPDAAPPHETTGPLPVKPRKEEVTISSNLYQVTSPMVGTFYRSPSPESPSFVDVGTAVSKGQTLCIIEAMKLMNELESEVSGVVRRIAVENGKPVEFGQLIMEIEVQAS